MEPPDTPLSQTPRPPTEDELRQLAGRLRREYGLHPDETGYVHAAYIAVYDHYQTGCPGYCGKLMSVEWDGAPSFFDVFTWEQGTMVRSGREYGEKECDRCGGRNGTLCANCWRQEG